MGFFKSLFGSEEIPADDEKRKEERDFDVLRTDGQRASRIGQHDFAIQCFKKALEIKDDLEVHDYLAHALIGANRLDEAVQELILLQRNEPDNSGIALLLAQVYYMKEDYQHMAESLEGFLQENNSLVLYWLAKAYVGLEDNSKTLEMLDKSIEANAENWDAWLLRCQTYLKLDKIEEAEKDSNHLSESLTEQEDVLLMQARIALKKGDKGTSLDIYNKVIDINPFSVEGFRERGLLYKQLGNEEAGNADLQMSESINGELVDQDIKGHIEQRYKDFDAYGIFS